MSAPASARRCALTAGFRPTASPQLAKLAAAAPQLVGSWDHFSAPAAAFAADGTDWMSATLPLPPGVYQYAIVVGDQLVLDELNPETAWSADPRAPGSDPLGTELSQVEIADCSQPALTITRTIADADSLTIEARFTPGWPGSPLDPRSIAVALARGPEGMSAPPFTTDGDLVRVRAAGLPAGKYTVRMSARDRQGAQSATAAASVFVEPAPGRALSDGLVYQVLVDRFRGPSGALAAPASPGDRAGGTLDGVRAAVEAGYFERLGVTTLWLSPLYQNPPGRFVGRDGRLYEAYHGYWPSAPRTVEPALGGEAALDALVAAAHARGLRLVLDVVPHHVHQLHEYYQQHSRLDPAVAAAPDPRMASWFLDGPDACVCGAPGCGWSDRLEDCWFASYLPDLNWRLPRVADVGAGDLAWWLERFDLDGLRVDAVPMMPRSAARAIVRATRAGAHREGLDQLVLGEIYTGPGDAGRDEIRYYLGRDLDGLDSAFDFPLMWQARRVIARGEGSFADLEADIAAADAAFGGSGAVMAHFVDNHDTSRFVSEAAGDGGGDPWLAPAAQPATDEPYRRHRLALALMLTLPGLPVLYYGDEVALAGAGDPDARRVLPDMLAPSALPPQMSATLDFAARLGRLRRCLPALRNVRHTLYTDADRTIALHLPPSPDGEPVVVALSRSAVAADVAILGLPAGRYRDALSGRTFSSDGGAHISIGPLEAAIYLPEGSACAE
ncbi:MAG TPA: alpha-amylase family glycosyl hydrolase [Polyangia bacterium]|nr:alpha-amylase family glycosyl hydrolase [Polyangia bacterium]